jgi:hypothetical protein
MLTPISSSHKTLQFRIAVLCHKTKCIDVLQHAFNIDRSLAEIEFKVIYSSSRKRVYPSYDLSEEQISALVDVLSEIPASGLTYIISGD